MSGSGSPGVLLLTTFLQGGAGRAITDLAVGLHEAGRRVAVVTSRTPIGDACNYPEYLERLRESGVNYLTIDSTFSRDRLQNQAAASAISNAFVLEDFSVIHSHAATPSRIGLLLAPRTSRALAVVQTMHGWGLNKTPEHAAQDVATMNRIARVITTSRASADDIVALGVSEHRIVTIPCGIDEIARSLPLPGSFEPIAKAQARGMAIVACVGSLAAFKNQSLVVEALARLPEPVDAGVMFIGEGSGLAALEALARERGVGDRVWCLGYQPAAASLLSQADLFVQASRSEGQGLAVIEAMRARVPVVASDIPVLRELVTDGKTGFLFASNDPDALANAIARALQLPPADRAAVLDRAYAQFSRQYTVTAMRRSHDALYDLVAKTGQGQGLDNLQLGSRN